MLELDYELTKALSRAKSEGTMINVFVSGGQAGGVLTEFNLSKNDWLRLEQEFGVLDQRLGELQPTKAVTFVDINSIHMIQFTEIKPSPLAAAAPSLLTPGAPPPASGGVFQGR